MTAGNVLQEAALRDIGPDDWDALAGDQPCLRHAFLAALHDSGSASPRSGWTPRFLTLRRAGRLVGALPLYEKSHSFGEFVFDWAWAEAWERAGMAYYPKLLTAVPFTPIPGPRVLAADDESRAALIDAALEYARSSGLSSWHVLFPSPDEVRMLADRGLHLRRNVQFHWRNAGYRDFGDFLDSLTREKRKKIRQERRRVAEAGVTLAWRSGRQMSVADWRFFYRCYAHTYAERGQRPHLTPAFFEQIGATLPDSVAVVIAMREDRAIAAALNLIDRRRLYGRYWGALEYVPCLHFEACYYQGIEYGIARRLETFEGGAQGEHKLARGFEPVTTLSAHWLRDGRLDSAVAHHVAREGAAIAEYVDELNERRPYRA